MANAYILQDTFREAEDLSPEIDLLFGSERDMSLLSFVRFLPATLKATNEKHEWQDDTMPPESLSVTASASGAEWDSASGTTGLPVATGQIEKLKVGDVLLLPSGEQVIVATINVSGQSITVSKRGWGGTTGAQQGTGAKTLYVIGNAQVDGSDPMDANYYAPSERYNYVQIFEDSLGISGKVMRSKISRESERARQRALKLKRLLSQLNYAILNGTREKTGNVATFQGLRNTASSTYNINGALTVAKVYAILAQMIAAGGSPSAFHGNAVMIGRLEVLLAAYVTSGTSDWHAKLTVNKVSILGMTIELHMDKHMADGELLVIDYDRVRYGTQDSDEAKGSFQAYVIEENGKQIKEQLVGYYTVEQKQAAASVVRAYGSTS